MNILHMLFTVIEAILLMVVLQGKNVTTPNGTALGKVYDIEVDFSRDEIWLVVKNQEQWNMICSEQIVNLIDRVILI